MTGHRQQPCVVPYAQSLLGAILSARVGGVVVALQVTEVEAYAGAEVPASHAFRGRTPRNSAMFGPPRHLYVYRHLGLHHCINISAGGPENPAAVLIRAGRVIAGLDVAWARRTSAGRCHRERDLARGPGRLAVTLGMTLKHNQLPMGQATSLNHLHDVPDLADGVWLVPGDTPKDVVASARVGVSEAGRCEQQFPWRFFIADEPTVSRFR